MRVTPAGIPIGQFEIEHGSTQREAGMERRIQCRLTVLAVGNDFSSTLPALMNGAKVRVQGFLNWARLGENESRLVLHAQSIELV